MWIRNSLTKILLLLAALCLPAVASADGIFNPGLAGGSAPFGSTPYVFPTKAAFQASTPLPANINYVTVLAVTGTYPPATGLDATSLTYRRVNSSSLFGAITVNGVVWEPIYSTSPVLAAQFGTVADGVYTSSHTALTAGVVVVCPGSSATCTTSSATLGIANGQLVGIVNWHSQFNGATWQASGDGTTATVTGAWRAAINVGASVTIAGMTPAGYNGTFTVTASSAGSVSFLNATTGIQTVAGTLASAQPIPIGTTVASFVTNASVTFSTTIPAGTYPIFAYTQAMTGTDNTPFIQAAINFALPNNYPRVQLPNGRILVASTVQAGWGNALYQLQVLGSGALASTDGFVSGTVLLCSMTNSPCLNYQGILNGACSGIGFQGLNQLWAEWTQNFPSAGTGGGLSFDALDWLDPNLWNSSMGSGLSGGIQQNSPYGGITFDAYGGPQPAIPYPFLTPPAFTRLNVPTLTASGTGTTATLTGTFTGGIGSFAVAGVIPVGTTITVAGVTPVGYNGTYTVTASSLNSVSYANTTTGAQTIAGTILWQYSRNVGGVGDYGKCEVDGFGVAFASGLTNSSGGDGLKLNAFNFQNNVYGVVIANSQSRTFEMLGSDSSGEHTAFSNDLLGVAGGGELNGLVTDMESGGLYQLFHVNGTVAGPTAFSNVHCERCVRIGTFIGTSGQSPFKLENLQFEGGDFGTFVIPTSLMDGNADIQLIAPQLSSLSRVPVLYTGSGRLTQERGQFLTTLGASPSTFVQTFVNYVGGVFPGTATTNTTNTLRYDVPYPYQGEYYISGSPGTKYYGNILDFNASGGLQNRVPIDPIAVRYRDQQNQLWDLSKPFPVAVNLATPGITAVAPATSGDTLTLQYCSALQAGAKLANQMALGDGLFQGSTNTLFVVNAITGPSGNDGVCSAPQNHYTVTAQQQNNMNINASLAWTKNNNPDPTFSGNFGQTNILKASIFAPRILSYGSVTSACAFSNISIGDGTTQASPNLGTFYVAGDNYYGLPNGNPAQPWFVPLNGMTLGAITNGAPPTGAIAAGTGTCTPTANVPIFPVALLSGSPKASSNAFISGGTKPVLNTGACVGSAAVGGATVGTFTAATCGATTLIISSLPTAPNGYACSLVDQTTGAVATQTATAATSATFAAVTSTSGNTMAFSCLGY